MPGPQLSKASSNGHFEGPHERQDGNIHDLTQSNIDNDHLEPIAIVGLDLKFPQDAVSADTFWQLLAEGRSALTEVPEDRFNIDAFYHPDATRATTVCIEISSAICQVIIGDLLGIS